MRDSNNSSEGAPPLIIDEADYDYLYRLAEEAAEETPDVGDYLLEEISRARLVPSAEMPADVVRFGAWVTYQDEASGEERRVQLVYPKQADASHSRISVVSPLGAALIGLSVGQTIDWAVPQRVERTLKVVKVQADSLPD